MQEERQRLGLSQRQIAESLVAPLPITKQVLSEEEFNQTQRGNVASGPNGQYYRQIGGGFLGNCFLSIYHIISKICTFFC